MTRRSAPAPGVVIIPADPLDTARLFLDGMLARDVDNLGPPVEGPPPETFSLRINDTVTTYRLNKRAAK